MFYHTCALMLSVLANKSSLLLRLPVSRVCPDRIPGFDLVRHLLFFRPCAVVQMHLLVLEIHQLIPIDARMHHSPSQTILHVLIRRSGRRVALECHVVGTHYAETQVLEAVLQVCDPILVDRRI
jgi:hypothetical protein